MFSSENIGSSVRGPDGAAEARRQTNSSTVPRNLSARTTEATSCCRVGFGGDKLCCGDVDAVGAERLAMALGERFNERTMAWSQDILQPVRQEHCKATHTQGSLCLVFREVGNLGGHI